MWWSCDLQDLCTANPSFSPGCLIPLEYKFLFALNYMQFQNYLQKSNHMSFQDLEGTYHVCQHLEWRKCQEGHSLHISNIELHSIGHKDGRDNKDCLSLHQGYCQDFRKTLGLDERRTNQTGVVQS